MSELGERVHRLVTIVPFSGQDNRWLPFSVKPFWGVQPLISRDTQVSSREQGQL